MTTLRLFRPAVAHNTANNTIDWTNLLDRFFENDNRWDYHQVTPRANILEFDESFRIDLFVPGVAKDEIKIEVENERLVISKEQKEVTENQNYRLREFGTESFERTFTLSKDIDSGNIKASYENGILSVTLPKKEEAKPFKKEIEIK